MLTEIYDDSKQRMEKSIVALKQAFSKIRTGRAHPSLLDHVQVSYYGVDTPLKQVANVTAEDARTIAITPWEKNMVAPIEKAIMSSDLGLNPSTAGLVIRIPIPPLTEERRRDMIRIVKQEAESARVAIRNIRRDANADFKEMLKEKMISEDEDHKAQEKIQQLTNTYVAKVDELLKQKEDDLLTI